MRKKFKKQLVAFAVIAIFLVFVGISSNQGYSNRHTQDSVRLSDIHRMKLTFEFYFNANNRHPVAEVGCQNMDELEGVVSPDFIAVVPQERYVSDGYSPYQYAVSSDGNQYVLQVQFEDKEHTALRNYTREYEGTIINVQTQDLDGIILGCDCNDPNYCVGSDNFSN